MIDVEAQFPVLLERCLGIVRKAFPITGKKYVLSAANWRWENVGEAVQNDIAQQRAAKLKESSITAKLVADLTIKDLTGKVIDRAAHHVILRIPHVTARSSYIVNGKELQVVNQLRLRPGLYTRLSSDNNVETFVNTAAAGTYRIILDREKGAFLFRVGPSAHFPLPAVLRALGVSDDAMRKAWGQTIYDRSVEGLDYDHEIKKLLLKLRPSVKTAGPEETMKTVREFLESKPFDPKVNLITVGRAYAGITGEAFLEASKKCLGVSQGKQKADDTESLAFKSLHSLEDFVPERLEKSLQSIVWEIQHRVDREPKIAVAVHPGLFTDPVTSFFTTSEFARHTDQSNPIDMIGANFLTTTMGEGGIGSVHAVTDAVRLVHPSHAGVLDGVHTPEGCYSDDMEVMTRGGWRRWAEVTSETEFACLTDDGFLEFNRSSALIRKHYVGPMYGFRSETVEYLLTPEHRQWVRPEKLSDSTSPVKQGRVRGYRFETAEKMSTKRRVVRIAGHLPYVGSAADLPLFHLPGIAKGSNAQKDLGPFDPVDWAEFLGWYLSEGCSSEYVVEITQYESVHPDEVRRIGDLLTRMGLTWSRSYKKFSICGRQLVAYLDQFGLCRDKFIPDSIFELSAEARHAFLEAAMLGDGRKGRRGAGGNAYCSTSRRMAEDVQRLAFSLGISSRIVFEPDTRKPHYVGCWVVHMHTCTERYVFPKMRTPGDGQFIQDYDGEVFCATVPGNRLYVRRNNKGGFWSGNSKIGISGHLTIGAKKVGTEIHVPVVDARTGQKKTLSTKDLDTKVIAFPDQFDLTGKKPRPLAPMVKGRRQADLGMFKASEVDYVFSNPQSFFSSTSNMVPFLHNDDGNRVGMADRHIEQTIGLKDPDAPLVQARFGARGYEEAIGHGLDPVSPVSGKVVKVTSDQIVISDGKKQHVVGIHDNYPLNSDGFMHDTPIVKKGQTVKAGEAVARNSFTNGKGTLALGKNLRIAYMPYAGYNFEDGMVISQSAAQKLTSVHKYEEKLERDSSTKIGMKLLLAHYPDQVKSVAKRDDYDADGVIKPGAVVQEGALLIPAVRRQELHADYDYARLHRALSNQWLDVSLYWQNATPGTVIDVIRQHGFIKVILKTEEPARIGDKLSMRHGGKGIVTAILPDGEMYRDQSGAVMDVLFNPTGVVGRVNPGQMYEAAAGKVARTTGKTFYVDNFSSGSSLDKVKKALKDAGLNEHGEETVTDPATGKKFERVLVGDTHFLKLRHRVAKKFSARGVGGAYTLNEQPAKTEEGSAQRIGGLELYALLSGDATNFVKDAFGVKGQKNDAYWRAVQLGLPTPPPKPPMVSEKFLTYMQGAGIDLERRGVFLQAAPMTDAKVLASSNGAIKEPTVVTANDLKPEKGGLFDPAVTGGIGGEHWSHIELPEPIVHPLMTKAAASVLDIPEKDLAKLSEGGLGLLDGKLVDPTTKGAKTGGEAVRELLGAVNVEAELKKISIEYGATRSAAKKDKLIKRRRFLEALKTLKLTPSEAYTMKYVPVIPAKFRAVYPLPDGSLNVSDPIHGYREVLMVSNALRDMKTMGLDRTKLTALRRDLSGAVAGLVGTQEPLTRSAHFKGFLAAVKGASNKSGFFQGRVMSRPQDLSARSTIIPDPKFGLDQVGIPEKMALTIYKPFVVRRLVGLGHKPIDAREMVEKGDPTALAALAAEVKDRPVILNRAPSLHKFNVMGFKPTLIQGEAIKINPLVVSGYNADFDGNCIIGCSLLLLRVAVGFEVSSVAEAERVLQETYGMKFSGDSKLLCASADGLVVQLPIRDFPHIGVPKKDKNGADVYEVPSGVEVLTTTPGGGSRWSAVTHWTVENGCRLKRITTRRGREVTASDNESVAAYGVGGELVKIRPQDAVGRFAPVVVHAPVLGSDYDSEFGWLIGAFLSDGWVTDKTIGYTKVSAPHRERFVRVLSRVIDNPVIARTYSAQHKAETNSGVSGQSTKIHVNLGVNAPIELHDLADTLRGLVGEGEAQAALRKRLPLDLMRWSRAARLGLLAGLLDGDGSLCVSTSKGKPQVLCSFATSSEQMRDGVVWLCRTLGIRVGVSTTKPSTTRTQKHDSFTLSLSTVDIARVINELPVFDCPAAEQLRTVGVSKDDTDILPCDESLLRLFRDEKNAAASYETLSVYIGKAKELKHTTLSRTSARALLAAHQGQETEEIRRWKSIVEDTTTHWDRIETVEDAPTETVYDLAVPETKVFALASGLVVYDTMGVHVPITEAARKEVLEKLLPSKNLFSPASDRVVNQPTMEMVLGLYLMSNPVGKPMKATSLADVVRGYMAKKHAVNTAFEVAGKTVCAGQAVLNQALPEYARIEGPMTKKVMTATIEKVARRDPKAAGEVLNKLKDLGNHYVTEIGFSVSLRDLAIDTKQRDAILDRAVKRAKTIGFSQASNEAAKAVSTMVHADHANRFVVMSTGSGALGSKAGSVNRLVATPVAVTDHKGDAIPVQIRKSYAEGHDLGSYWATLPGARKGMMDKGLSTADTGYLTKRLVQANIDTVVSEIDCGTTRGVTLPVDNPDVIGRFVVGGRLAGKLITPEIARTLKGTVEVRSPLTCMAKRGICSKCFGLNENGQLYPVGYHLGVLAAQTIGEPSTQLSLKAFHVGGAVGQGSTNKGFHRVDQLFTLPDNVKGRAILSADSGKITRIAPNALGGWDVYVGKTKHYVPHEVGLGVKPGQTVAAGDHLSARGDIRPQDVLETTGSIDRVRTTLINELHDNFSSSGVNIKRRIYETVVKPMTKWAKVTDAGGSTQFHPGDVVLVDRIENENATLPANKKIMFEPMLVGVGKVPHLGEDFIGRMMHDRIIDTAREAAALGRRSNTGPDGHPVARLAFEGASQGGSPAGIRRTKVQ